MYEFRLGEPNRFTPSKIGLTAAGLWRGVVCNRCSVQNMET